MMHSSGYKALSDHYLILSVFETRWIYFLTCRKMYIMIKRFQTQEGGVYLNLKISINIIYVKQSQFNEKGKNKLYQNHHRAAVITLSCHCSSIWCVMVLRDPIRIPYMLHIIVSMLPISYCVCMTQQGLRKILHYLFFIRICQCFITIRLIVLII